MTSDAILISKLREMTAMMRDAALEAGRASLAYALKFNPDQPRVSAGSPEGGQWTSDRDSSNEGDDTPATFELAARRGRSEAFCWNQLTIDLLLCNTVTPAWRYVVCRSQAMERYAACISGRPLPPLSY